MKVVDGACDNKLLNRNFKKWNVECKLISGEHIEYRINQKEICFMMLSMFEQNSAGMSDWP
jgi:hypothetical protein